MEERVVTDNLQKLGVLGDPREDLTGVDNVHKLEDGERALFLLCRRRRGLCR